MGHISVFCLALLCVAGTCKSEDETPTSERGNVTCFLEKKSVVCTSPSINIVGRHGSGIGMCLQLTRSKDSDVLYVKVYSRACIPRDNPCVMKNDSLMFSCLLFNRSFSLDTTALEQENMNSSNKDSPKRTRGMKCQTIPKCIASFSLDTTALEQENMNSSNKDSPKCTRRMKCETIPKCIAPTNEPTVTTESLDTSTEIILTSTRKPDVPDGENRIGLAIGMCILIILTSAILGMMCRSQYLKRTRAQGVDWNATGYMGVTIQGSSGRQSKVEGQIKPGGFSNLTYAEGIALDGSNRTIDHVVPREPAHPEAFRLTREGYVEYNPESDQRLSANAEKTSNGGKKYSHQDRPLPVPNISIYEEITDIVPPFQTTSSIESPSVSPPHGALALGHDSRARTSTDGGKPNGYVDVDYRFPGDTLEPSPDTEGLDPHLVAGETKPDAESDGNPTLEATPPAYFILESSTTGPTLSTPHGEEAIGYDSRVRPSTDGGQSKGYVDVDYSGAILEPHPKTEGPDSCLADETTPIAESDENTTIESNSNVSLSADPPSNEAGICTDHESAAQGVIANPDGTDDTCAPLTVLSEAGMSEATAEQLTLPLETINRKFRSLTSPYSKLDRGPLWKHKSK